MTSNSETIGTLRPIDIGFPRLLTRPGSPPEAATWLPAPELPKPVRHDPPPSAAGIARLLNGLRMEKSKGALAEPLLMLLLAAGSGAAIVFGFSRLIDLVEHWALFNNVVERLLS